ncbi:MAG TPA: hypothetical protein VEK76_11250 [Candidatus Binatia bacterium]|nr:hypothetical protein [Candidatus Binatia bacterium]
MSCPTAGDCWAVGGDLIEHYDGSAWSLASAPRGFDGSGVSCPSGGLCWAVGGRADASMTSWWLIETDAPAR